jgi:hypothetical protein
VHGNFDRLACCVLVYKFHTGALLDARVEAPQEAFSLHETTSKDSLIKKPKYNLAAATDRLLRLVMHAILFRIT